MATDIYPTLRKIRDTHAWKRDYERYLPFSRFVFRPAGFLLTWLAIRIGLTSEAVSWMSGFVALIGCLCLISNQEYLLPIGIGLLLFFNLLDCVDGSISRTMKTENPYGKFLDSLMAWVDMGFWALIGVMVLHHPKLLLFSNPMGYGPICWLAAGGLACYFYNLIGYVERIFDQDIRKEWESIGVENNTNLKNKSKDESIKQDFHRKNPPFSVVRIICHNLKVRETHYFLLILTYWINAIDLLLACYLFYYFINTFFLIIIYGNRGRQLLKSYNA